MVNSCRGTSLTHRAAIHNKCISSLAAPDGLTSKLLASQRIQLSNNGRGALPRCATPLPHRRSYSAWRRRPQRAVAEEPFADETNCMAARKKRRKDQVWITGGVRRGVRGFGTESWLGCGLLRCVGLAWVTVSVSVGVGVTVTLLCVCDDDTLPEDLVSWSR